MLACGLPPSSTCECSEQIFLPPSPAMAWDLRDPCNVQAKTLLLKASPFRTLEALLSLFDDLNGGTGVMYVRAQRQRLKGDLVPHVVDGCKDIRDRTQALLCGNTWATRISSTRLSSVSRMPKT